MAADRHHRGRLLRGGPAWRRCLPHVRREQWQARGGRHGHSQPHRFAHHHAHGVAHAEPATHCSYTPSGTPARKVGVPPVKPAFRASKYQATIKTNRGPIVVDLLNHQATCTVNSFIYLAVTKYFNATPCHRLTTSGIYVLQCGDPTGTGRGGPGYKFADENLAGAKYTAGTVAMANSGPGTNGSQFFLVYRNSTLPASYTPFGEIVGGLGIIQNVARAGTDNSNGNGDGHPKQKVTIERVTITKA